QPAEFSHMPISNRLAGILQRYGLQRLGDLPGLSPKDFRACRNCGAGTLKELVGLVKRAEVGEFDSPGVLNPSELLALLDECVAQLPRSMARAVQLRFGAREDRLLVMPELGRALKRDRLFARQTL